MNEQMKQDRLNAMRERYQQKYEKSKQCKDCEVVMNYEFGEIYKCPKCGRKELSDFGLVRQYLDANGPKPAAIIADATGVDIKVIDGFLREGRVEIPDGSGIYIKCQSCGTDIRYGRFCPECMAKLSKNISSAMWSSDVGERPTKRPEVKGKMHHLRKSDDKK